MINVCHRTNPKFREWEHWLVVNIPGSELDKGDTLCGYMGAAPPKGSGLHRYVLLVFKQAGPVDVSQETHLKADTSKGRANFSISKFAAKHGFGDPVAANFFKAQNN